MSEEKMKVAVVILLLLVIVAWGFALSQRGLMDPVTVPTYADPPGVTLTPVETETSQVSAGEADPSFPEYQPVPIQVPRPPVTATPTQVGN